MSQDLTAEKAALRREMKAQLSDITARESAESSKLILQRLSALWKAHPSWHLRPVAAFVPLPSEPGISVFTHSLTDHLTRVIYPRDDSFWPQVDEPFLLILIPGLAFDAQGYRLGRGGGWYDRVLSHAAPDALKVGVCFERQIVARVPHEAHDVRVDMVVTEDRLIRCLYPTPETRVIPRHEESGLSRNAPHAD